MPKSVRNSIKRNVMASRDGSTPWIRWSMAIGHLRRRIIVPNRKYLMHIIYGSETHQRPISW